MYYLLIMLSSGKIYLLQSGFSVSGPFHSLFVWFSLGQAGMLGRVVSNWVSIIDLGVVLQPTLLRMRCYIDRSDACGHIKNTIRELKKKLINSMTCNFLFWWIISSGWHRLWRHTGRVSRDSSAQDHGWQGKQVIWTDFKNPSMHDGTLSLTQRSWEHNFWKIFQHLKFLTGWFN